MLASQPDPASWITHLVEAVLACAGADTAPSADTWRRCVRDAHAHRAADEIAPRIAAPILGPLPDAPLARGHGWEADWLLLALCYGAH